MLTLITNREEKKALQRGLEDSLKNMLDSQGNRRIGFPGGSNVQEIYSAGNENLWVAFGGPMENARIPRYWNAFGIYHPDRPTQSISVEINIAIDSDDAQVAGFFAKDSETGDIFLMHSGKIGGGRRGIGKSHFLAWSQVKLVEVANKNGCARTGIAVSRLGGPDMAGRIRAFVNRVQRFKDMVATGDLETPEFKRRMEEFDRYRREFSGRKRGIRSGTFEYVTYHGDIVQSLYEERIARLSQGEEVFNSVLIDLFVKKDGILSEVYEVKTGVGRQILYTAIGQVVTHAASDGGEAAKVLVIPADDTIPEDMEHAIAKLGIEIRRFRIGTIGGERVIELV